MANAARFAQYFKPFPSPPARIWKREIPKLGVTLRQLTVDDVELLCTFSERNPVPNFRAVVYPAYVYWWFCQFFNETCTVALKGSECIGFHIACKRQTDPRQLFGIQAMLKGEYQNQGIFSLMLSDLLARPVCKDVEWYEGTIETNNWRVLEAHLKLLERWNVEEYMLREVPQEEWGNRHHPSKHMRVGKFTPEKTAVKEWLTECGADEGQWVMQSKI
eukprot:TRINITY_DN66334_c0_g1_i1.p1 TRINITY_DN66334_c0_g1~~TRINITY_DN66334_c0_g1_i1.p1  ORF type:complete len:227 (-),score=3.12 TRINITY_DN66334_c0_g1_i1:291-944(-)